MTREEAANKMLRLRHMFVGLEIVRIDDPASAEPEKPSKKPPRRPAHKRPTPREADR